LKKYCEPTNLGAKIYWKNILKNYFTNISIVWI